MVGRAAGPDIVQLGTDSAGLRRRWGFSEISPDAFRWRGDVIPAGAAEDAWHCHMDVRARRVG